MTTDHNSKKTTIQNWFSRGRIRLLLLICLFLISACVVTKTTTAENSSGVTGKNITTPYTDPKNLTSLPFGYYSHWIQPWRAYLETVPARDFLDGTGIVFNVKKTTDPDLVAQMLAKHGIRQARFEISWGKINYNDETKLNDASEFRTKLLALKKNGIRPLILLNAHQGNPCPLRSFKRTVTQNAAQGATTIQLDNVKGLKVRYSGLSNLSDYWAAEALITDISGNTVKLSKPLQKRIKAGTSVSIATLKYLPFSPPNGKDYANTISGWQSYVDTVANFAAEVLGTTQSSDKGFDMEVWNELSFGSKFLSINNYYTPNRFKYKENSIWKNLVTETIAYVKAHSEDFEGVSFTNGFGNTIPWTASSEQPARIAAISKHPYSTRRKYFPKNNSKGKPVNALYEVEGKSAFSPTYSTFFPEYSATAIQTETIIRDIGPITTKIHSKKHGRNARVINGDVVPTPVWITEVNTNPKLDDPKITAERALAIKAKTTARLFSFFLNKGVTRLYLYSAARGNKEWGIVKQNFLNYASRSEAIYPEDDTSYTSPALATLDRIVTKMSDQVDLKLTKTRQLEIVSIGDTHNHFQFAGDGTEAHPKLYDRDVFAFLPFQANARRFVIPYYVMTRDVMEALQPEEFTVKIKGLRGSNAVVIAYDPVKDRTLPARVQESELNSLTVLLTATDYPYLLIVQESV